MKFHRRVVDPAAARIRPVLQLGFLALNAGMGATFLLWVQAHERNVTPIVDRPAGIEGWLPIAGLMNLWSWIQSGELPIIHPAAALLLAVFLSMSLLFRKAFCGWLCPIGTVSEALWKFGRSTFRRNFYPPRWLDWVLRAPKYLVLGFFVWAIAPMDPASIADFMRSPYGLAADVRLLGFFRQLSVTAAVVIGVFALGSVFVPNLWCKYACPYGALMGIAALASPLRIRRTPAACIDCGKCAKACPSHLAVDRLVQIRSAECLGCLECVQACPAEGALDLMAPGRRVVKPAWIAIALVSMFLSVWMIASWRGYWESPIPEAQYRELIQHSDDLPHP